MPEGVSSVNQLLIPVEVPLSDSLGRWIPTVAAPIRRSVTAVLGALLACAGGAAPTEAQMVPSPYTFIEAKQEVGPFVGWMRSSTGRFGFGPKGGPVLGARWGIELAGPVSLEGVAGLIRGERDVIDPGRDEGDRVIGTADANIATVDARLKFTLTGARAWHGFAPFLVFGGGLAIDGSGVAPADADLLPADRFDFGTSFFGTLGGGSRWFLSDRLALRGDAVFSLWKLDTPPGFSDPERGFEAVEEGEWVSGLTLTLAVLYRW